MMTSSIRSFDAQVAGPFSPLRTVEVFADVRCPFAYVGLLRFVEKRREVGASDVSLVVRAWPLELVNGVPLDAGLMSQKVRALRDQVAPSLFSGFDERAFPATSMPALRLEAWARRQSADAGERVSFALRSAMFEHGRDIADVEVLREIAASCGVDDPVSNLRQRRHRGLAGRKAAGRRRVAALLRRRGQLVLPEPDDHPCGRRIADGRQP